MFTPMDVDFVNEFEIEVVAAALVLAENPLVLLLPGGAYRIDSM